MNISEDKICLLDEAQQLTHHEILSFLTRLQGKAILTGDLVQQSARRLSLYESGLFKAIDVLKNCEQAGHLTLKTVQRSPFVDYINSNWK
jgi:predicted ribonuclease YlaK